MSGLSGVLSLVGPRGSGKTTVGRRLADWFGCDFADSDGELVRRDGRDIPKIFHEDGEAGFRTLEADVIATLLIRDPLVLATGGGAVLNADTRRRLRGAGEVIYLRADAATLHARTAGDPNRPPLTDLPAGEEVARVLADRDPLYREVAAHVVDAAQPVDDVVNDVLCRLVDEDRA